MAIFNKKENSKKEAKTSKESSPDTSSEVSREEKDIKSDSARASRDGKTDVKKEAVIKTSKTPENKISKATSNNARSLNHSGVLLRPRITEKASFAEDRHLYIFEIDPRATKTDVINAIVHLYKVKPVKVNVTKIPPKQRVSQFRKMRGIKSGGKKAYVYLKKGDSIEIV